MLLRDPKTGRMLSRFESLARQNTLAAKQVGQSVREQSLTALEFNVEQDSPAVKSYCANLISLVREHLDSATELQQKVLPFIRETRAAAEVDKTLSKGESRRIAEITTTLEQFVRTKTRVLTRMQERVRTVVRARASRLRTGMSESLSQTDSIMGRLAGSLLRQREKTRPEGAERGIFQARADLYKSLSENRDAQKAAETQALAPAEDKPVSRAPRRAPAEPSAPAAGGKSNATMAQLVLLGESTVNLLTAIYTQQRKGDELSQRGLEASARDRDNVSPVRENTSSDDDTRPIREAKRGLLSKLFDSIKEIGMGVLVFGRAFLGARLTGMLTTMGRMLFPIVAKLASALSTTAAVVATFAAAFKVGGWLDRLTGNKLSNGVGRMASIIEGGYKGFKEKGDMGVIDGMTRGMTDFDKSIGRPTTAPSPRRTQTPITISTTPKLSESAPVRAQSNVQMIRDAMTKHGFGDATAQANVLGQVGRETGGKFAPTSENLNYQSFDRFKTVFGKRAEFKGKSDKELKSLFETAKQQGPEAIAELVYGPETKKGRELGNTQKGDGFRYRGRGFLQITGRAAYRDISRILQQSGINIDLEKNPELVNDPLVAAHVVPAFLKWKGRSAEQLKDITTATRTVTGAVGGAMGAEQLSEAKRYAAIYAAPAPSAVRSAAPVATLSQATRGKSSVTVIAPQTNINGGNGAAQSAPAVVPVPIAPENPDATVRALRSINGL